jgi:cytochrome c-type biogenesis protein
MADQIAALLQPVHKDVTLCCVTRRGGQVMSDPMFGIEIIDAALLPAMLVALVAGIISFLSPCVLPIVPPYLAYISGVSLNDLTESGSQRARAVMPALFFVLGLSTVFLFLGFTASAIGTVFLQYQGYFNTVAGILVMAFGAHFVGVYRFKFLDREARIDAGDRGGSSFGAYILGLAFAFGWTPCIGPQLGAILSLAASEANVARGTSLLAVYAIGLGVPFILVAAFLPRLQGLMGWMKRHMEQIERVMGLLLWTIGLLMLTGGFSAFSFWLLETFPALAVLG